MRTVCFEVVYLSTSETGPLPMLRGAGGGGAGGGCTCSYQQAGTPSGEKKLGVQELSLVYGDARGKAKTQELPPTIMTEV